MNYNFPQLPGKRYHKYTQNNWLNSGNYWGSQASTRQICVNFVRSHDRWPVCPGKIEQIINTLLYADYTGVFPIVMERVNFLSTNDADKTDELQAQLLSNVVCILEANVTP